MMKTVPAFRYHTFALMSLGLLLTGCTWMETKLAQRPVQPRPQQESATPNSQQIANVQFALARSLERDGNLEAARDAYLRIIEKDAKAGDVLHRLAIVYDRLGENSEADAYFKRAMKASPANADLYCDLGYSQYLRHNWADAERNLKQSIELKSNLARAHNNLGLLYAQTDRLAEAFDEFALAGCTPAEAHVNMAFVMSVREEWAAARDEYERALMLDPQFKMAQDRLQSLGRVVAAANNVQPGEKGAIQLTTGTAIAETHNQ